MLKIVLACPLCGHEGWMRIISEDGDFECCHCHRPIFTEEMTAHVKELAKNGVDYNGE